MTSRPAILVVDDDPLVRAITSRALAGLNHEVLEAEDGVQALAVLKHEEAANVRLVITDIRMPGMNGDDLGRVLRGLRPTLPVLYISGHSAPALDFLRPGELERCWLTKPFTPRRLIAKVEALLGEGWSRCSARSGDGAHGGRLRSTVGYRRCRGASLSTPHLLRAAQPDEGKHRRCGLHRRAAGAF